ncbi:MAG: hypothetical protein FWE36_08825 [Erysipelotrichales bacterium]|nr:hypothetical protein [Erysipelotrichales bacterium]MCL2676720.1 hypothetical protein [Streptococcaceae bacterium]
MVRKNYAELLDTQIFNPEQEINKLEKALNRNFSLYQFDTIRNIKIKIFNYDTYLAFLQKFSFLHYPDRQGYTNIVDFRNHYLSYAENTTEKLFIYSELLININKYYKVDAYNPDHILTWNIIRDNINYFLNLSNHELSDTSEGVTIIVEKNISASAAAQIVSETDKVTALKILEYNWFANKGNIESKKSILKKIADFLEPERKVLKSKTLKEIFVQSGNEISLVNDLFYMFNNLNVRHNNEDENSKVYNKKWSELTELEKENWYDDIYNTALLVIIAKEQIRIQENLRELKG